MEGLVLSTHGGRGILNLIDAGSAGLYVIMSPLFKPIAICFPFADQPTNESSTVNLSILVEQKYSYLLLG